MVFYLLQIQLRRDNPCAAYVQYSIRTRGGGGCNGKERRSREPEFRIQEGVSLTASAERRGYDSLILFKEITKLTKGDSYLCDRCDSRLDAVQIPGASRLSERGSYNGYRRRLEQELKHGMRRPSGSRRPRKRGSAPRIPPITSHFSRFICFRDV
jgi:hypothetical protein